MYEMKTRAILALLCVLAPAGALSAEPAPKLRVLLLSGRNNHDWKTTTPAMVKMLDASGRFAVTVTNTPEKLTGSSFATCDVILSNWTPWPNVKQRVWDAATEKAFVEFIRSGGGLVVVHASSTAFATWPEFRHVACGTWGPRTGHGARHEFTVTSVEKAHPITTGVGDFAIFDELWHRTQRHPQAKVLCTAFSAKDRGGSGADEPVAMVTRFGKGRGYYLVLGHDVKAMSAAGFRTLLLRGTEWAATGKVTIPPAAEAAVDIEAVLKAARGWKFGQSREPLVAVARAVAASATDPARRKKMAAALVRSLSGEATGDYRKFACGQLSLIGGDAEVPVLAGLLGDKDLSLAARSALERMGTEASLAAMRAALPKATGTLRVGLIGSLGERRDAASVGAIAGVLGADDAAAVGAAIDALGKIGGPAAADALRKAGATLPADHRPGWAHAMLRCAEGLLAAHRLEEAEPIFRELSAPSQPAHIRAAAFPGRVAARKDQAEEMVLAALTGQDAAMQVAAVRAVRLGADAKLLKALADALPRVAPSVRASVIEALAQRRCLAARAGIVQQASADDEFVRRAALSALGVVGDAASVAVLAGRAAKATGAEQAAARRSLVRLRADGTDKALVEALGGPEALVRREAAIALRQRAFAGAIDALLAAAEDKETPVRTEALKAVGALGGAKVAPKLIALLARAPGESGRGAVETALLAVCRRAGQGETAAEAVLAALGDAKMPATGSLLRVLSRLGGPKALAAIRSAVRDAKADVRAEAIRALASWSDAEPLEDLLDAAKAASEPVARVLALRGFVQLSAKAGDRAPKAMAGLYARAMALAERVEEKKALLSGLGQVYCTEALEAAEALRKDAALAGEAALAVVRIADKLWVTQPGAIRTRMKRLLAERVPATVKTEARRILLELSKPINLARDAKATSPDGIEKDGASGGDQAAIDGNPGTYWDEADGRKLYRLVVTFPVARRVAGVRITGYQHHSYAPKDFEILCDGKAVKSVRNAKYRENRLTVAFAETSCQSVELKITGYYALSPAIRELEIYGPDPDKKE